MTDEIPLFPLESVLLPGAIVSLQIFEPRYREMIARCLAERIGFGVALIRNGREVGEHAEPFDVGTVAHIARSERLADGRYRIEARGRERFRILSRDLTAHAYQVATVGYLDERDGTDAAEVQALRTQFEEAAHLARTLAGSWSELTVLPDDAVTLIYHIASRLRLEEREKLRILGAEDARERCALLQPHLEALVAALAAQVRAHRANRLRGFGSGN